MSMSSITDVRISVLGGTAPSIIFPGQQVAKIEHQPLLQELEKAIQQNPSKKMLCLPDGSRWRSQRMRADRYALRRMPVECPQLDELGLPQWVKSLLLSSNMCKTGGLIMILGHTGAGKTTTFSATVAARLALHGGYGLTLEDPNEHPLEGHHGKSGYCEQLDVDELGGYATAIRVALRCFPAKDASMLGYGEVLEPITAAELLRVGVDGHLVLATMHGKSIGEGLQRLAAMAKAAGEEDANGLLAASLQLAIHQKFDSAGRLSVSALPRENKSVAHIRTGEFAALREEVQRNLLSNM